MKRILAAAAATAAVLAVPAASSAATAGAAPAAHRQSCRPALRAVQHVARQAHISMGNNDVRAQPSDLWFMELDVAMNNAPAWYAPHLRPAVNAAAHFLAPFTAREAGRFVAAMRAAEGACTVAAVVK